MFRSTIFVVSPLIILHTDPVEQFLAELQLDYLRRLGNPPVINGQMDVEPFKADDGYGDYRVWINLAHGVDKSFRLTSESSNFEFAKLAMKQLQCCFCSLLRGEGMEKRTPGGWKSSFEYLVKE